ncbi:MBL fold metallo-hydrolase [Ureibacillus composti]
MKKFVTYLLALVLALSMIPMSTNAATKDLKVHFINVGQGDSILVQAPGGKNMLVDGGPKTSGDEVVSFLKSKGVTSLDYVVATHPDADHIGGLIDVLKSLKVKNFIDSGKAHTTETYIEILTLIDKKNINYIVPKTLDTYQLDPNMKAQVLHADENAEDNNDASIVLKLTYNKVSFLLTADASTDIEDQIRKKYNVQATVLKAGHHGSDTSSSAAFISNVKPKVAILSYGKNNSYGHPNSAVVSRLKNVGAKTYKTATDCNITVTTNGVKYSVSTACAKPTTSKPSTTTKKPTTTKPATTPVTKPATQTNFKNCTELRKVYPSGVSSSHAAYQLKMDRDKDGWACEK